MRNRFLISVNPEHHHAVRLMINHMTLARKSNVTIKTYSGYISKFIRLFNRLPEECTKHELIEFLLNQKEAYDVKLSTVKGYVCALRYYFTYIKDNEEFSLKIPVPKIKDYNIEVLTIREVKRLLTACTNPKQRLVIQMLYETGMRVSELSNLKLDHIDFNLKSITVFNGKNYKTRVIFFGKELENAILSYLKNFPTLFSNHQEHYSFLHLSSRSIQRVVQNISKKSGIKKRISPHILRHTFAVHYINFGGSICRLQRILGHAKIKTTLHYLQYSILPTGIDLSILDKLTEIE